ncbi:MAG: SLBB domain-containing protein [Bacteroides sp.]|nr:SLBB domain-containing protein [Bacteroides sp.]
MRKILSLLLFAFVFSLATYAQQMTDDQVVQYVKSAHASGKSQKQITTELLRRGVTEEQVMRIKERYEKTNSAAEGTGNVPTQMREVTRVTRNADSYEEAEIEDQKRVVDEERESQAQVEVSARQIFGHNIFTTARLSFEPSMNLPTPQNYVLGAGDEVVIHIWGDSEETIRQTISPEGNIMVSKLGPVHLNGMTVKNANSYLQREFAKIFSGIGGEAPSSQIKLTLGDVRTIQVNIMGEVSVPGTYTLSAFSSIFHALYRAGGVNNIGSLRSIKLVRKGKTIADVDVYQYIMDGHFNNDVQLQEGDVIIVNPYESLVEIVGKVKRPMYYEMKNTETVATLLDYAGGFTGDAYKKAVRIIRKSGREHQVFNVDEMDYSVFRLDDGDMITIDAVLDRFENRVEIRGAVYRAGLYQIDGNVNTVKALIKKAEGLRGDAFLNRALIDREHEDLSHEIIPVDLNALLNGTAVDIPLQKNDILYIPSINDLKQDEMVSIHGYVMNPGTFQYSKNMTIEDLIIQSGGLLESASMTNVTVTRRIKDPKSTTYSSVLGESFSFNVKDGFVVGGENFYLQPFDAVYVRKSPAYFEQQNVTISGKVMFDGVYALQEKNERLSDLVARAGGVTPDAYVKGARLIRKMSEEERRRQADVLRVARSAEGEDSISVDKLAMSETYSVGIDLEKALANPGGDYDLVMREGDQLYIPEYVNTVKISGSVMYPNTVLFKEGKKLKHYINMAGGYGDNAKKRRAYVIYMNGTVAKLNKYKSSLIQPGCEIVVPSKAESKKMSVAEMMSIGTTSASIATMIASMVNLFK